MAKSYTDLACDVLNVEFSILADALSAFPQLEEEFSRDWIRLTRLFRQRGLPFLLVDFPAMLKHLDKCLSAGTFSKSHLPGQAPVSATVVIPKLFRGLYQKVFESDGSLKEFVDVEALFFLRQLYAGAKKLRINPSDSSIRIAVDTFLRTDSSLPEVPRFWDDPDATVDPGLTYERGYGSKVGAGEERLLITLDRISGLISSSLGMFSAQDGCFRHGPGVVSDLRSSENRYRFDSWNPMLESCFPFADVCFSNYGWWVARGLTASEMTFPSKLAAVPKTFSKPRLIASEPHSNLWCQQAVRHHIYSAVDRSWIGLFIRFTDQTQNQVLALQGSRDGSLATIDLSDASDRVSCKFVSCLSRGNISLLRALRACRTQSVLVPMRDEILEVVLRKYSTMGNATTFPVESLGFLAIALAACSIVGGWEPTVDNITALKGKVSVFGDDIIVPTECIGVLTRLLEVLDFKVNASKTHLTGRFRESCGADCFAGQTITPACWYGPCEDNPESVSGTIEVSNNFYRKFLLRTAETVQSTIPRKYRFPLVPYDSGTVGFHSFVWNRECLRPFRSRRNADLQKEEWCVPGFISRETHTEITDDSALLQFFTEHPEPHVKWKSGVRSRQRLGIRRWWIGTEDLLGPKCTRERVPTQG